MSLVYVTVLAVGTKYWASGSGVSVGGFMHMILSTNLLCGGGVRVVIVILGFIRYDVLRKAIHIGLIRTIYLTRADYKHITANYTMTYEYCCNKTTSVPTTELLYTMYYVHTMVHAVPHTPTLWMSTFSWT